MSWHLLWQKCLFILGTWWWWGLLFEWWWMCPQMLDSFLWSLWLIPWLDSVLHNMSTYDIFHTMVSMVNTSLHALPSVWFNHCNLNVILLKRITPNKNFWESFSKETPQLLPTPSWQLSHIFWKRSSSGQSNKTSHFVNTGALCQQVQTGKF